jgi:hypothetical protein
MAILCDEQGRPSDSPFVERVERGRVARDGSTVRPAEINWHMVLARHNGLAWFILGGPWTRAGVVSFTAGAEILWIRLKLGVFMPHLPTNGLVDKEQVLPDSAGNAFWLHGSAWRFPDYENADTFVAGLVRDGALTQDPAVDAALHGRLVETSPRTLRRRFLHATGLSRGHIQRVERARRAESLLRAGTPILDTVHEGGYADQPHLTRSMKRWIGHTPAELLGLPPDGRSVQDKAPSSR